MQTRPRENSITTRGPKKESKRPAEAEAVEARKEKKDRRVIGSNVGGVYFSLMGRLDLFLCGFNMAAVCVPRRVGGLAFRVPFFA